MNNFSGAHVRAQPLSWKTRLIILIGVARGLTYVHSSKDEIIHRNVESSSILLDQVKLLIIYNFVQKLSILIIYMPLKIGLYAANNNIHPLSCLL